MDEDTDKVSFLNQAAKEYKIQKNGNISMQLNENEEFDRTQKHFALLDTALMKQTSDSAKIADQIAQLDDHLSLQEII